MPDILLTTLNAKFIHASLGLRYLLANLGGLRPRAALVEFEIKQPPLEIVETLLAHNPRLVGFGVYIWNVRQTFEVVTLLKRLRPEIIVVLGGPEVSYETDHQEIVALADYTIAGEADLAFAELCRALLAPAARSQEPGAGSRNPERQAPHPESCLAGPASRVRAPPSLIPAHLPDLSTLALPYDLYTDADLAHRVLYVEASRGCPFSCEFCLSSLDIPVRQFPLDAFLASLGRLLGRGARQFKFVDRTFNLSLESSRAILRFFRERWRDDLFLHFEMIPDRLPEALREEIAWFPPGALQLEIGIQSFNPEVCRLISRRQDADRTADNFRFLRTRTGVHIHADLIVGLPGESLESFAAGFDRLVALEPQEIQVGILKRLRGTPIVRHDTEWGMRYSPLPPYEILENRLIDFPTMQRLRRFARYWDLVANSGRFRTALPLIWAGETANRSPFRRFLAWSDWLYAETRQTHALALDRLAALLFRWLTTDGHTVIPTAANALADDWRRGGHRDLPDWLRPHLGQAPPARGTPPSLPLEAGRRRQARHLGGA